ncbi:MAG: hypothetical protein IKV54_05415 [Clostridia bacterium]|nr:hypothetical protein [Clostridia bacterium]
MKRKTGKEINRLTGEILSRERRRDEISAELFTTAEDKREEAVSVFSDYSDEIEELREEVELILSDEFEKEVIKNGKNRRKNKRDAHS